MVMTKPNIRINMFHIFVNQNAKFLPINLFYKFPNLTKYLANNCRFTTVYAVNLKNLKSLQEIEMKNNFIENIEQNAFDDLPFLQKVSFKNNSLQFLHGNIFSHSNELKIVNFSYNNLTALPTKIFFNVTSLDDVNFQHNQIKILQKGLFRYNRYYLINFAENNIVKICDSDWNQKITHTLFINFKLNICIHRCYAKDLRVYPKCFLRKYLIDDLRNCTKSCR